MITRSVRRPDTAIAVTPPENLVHVQLDNEIASAEHDIVHNHDSSVDVEEDASVRLQNLEQIDAAEVKISITVTLLEKLL